MRSTRTDSNQQEIVDALRSIGALVQDTHTVGRGFPDIVVGYRGSVYLMEIKAKGGKLNEREKAWHSLWDGYVSVVYTIEDAVRVIGGYYAG